MLDRSKEQIEMKHKKTRDWMHSATNFRGAAFETHRVHVIHMACSMGCSVIIPKARGNIGTTPPACPPTSATPHFR